MFVKLNLRFFDGAGASAGAAPTGADGGADGQTANAAEAQVTTTTQIDRAAEYAKLKADYKAEFSKDFEVQLADRLKGHRAIEARVKAVDPILTALASKYGVDPTDTDSLQKAIDSDESYYEREAEEEGLTVAQLKRQKALEAEVAAFKQERESAERDTLARQKLNEWTEQGVKLKGLYPGFDLAAEAKDPNTGDKFLKLLQGGLVNVQDAYELVHPEARDQRIQRGTAIVAQLAQQQTLDTIKAKGMRPNENGAGGNASSVKTDVSKMTPEQRRELNERAMRGEKIDLRTFSQ